MRELVLTDSFNSRFAFRGSLNFEMMKGGNAVLQCILNL